MTDLTTIPVVAQRTINLFALFDAFLAAGAWGLTLVKEDGAADALKAWAASRGLVAREIHFVMANGQRAYANLKVSTDKHGAHDITVLSYRYLTDEEVALVSKPDDFATRTVSL